MRTTVRIDDELLRTLKEQARKQNVSLTRIIHELTFARWIIRPAAFDSGLYRPPLRASLEQTATAICRNPQRGLDRARGRIIHEHRSFVNNAG